MTCITLPQSNNRDCEIEKKNMKGKKKFDMLTRCVKRFEFTEWDNSEAGTKDTVLSHR